MGKSTFIRTYIKQLLLPIFLTAGLTGNYPSCAQTVFINEIHYDNEGDDREEAIEIAGPAGTDLSGWSLVLYNGSGEVRSPYTATDLGGSLPDQQDGFGTVAVTYPINSIQNGAPDGLALVDSQGEVVQFLSYEGAFEAADGPARGLSSTDIGVAESPSTPAGFSLQLSGMGTTYDDFAWAVPADNSRGEINAGQAFGEGGGDPPAAIIINEVDADTPGSDTGEFVELYDGGTGNTSLDGLTVVFFNGSGDISYEAFDLDGFSTDATGFFVLGNPEVANVDLRFEPGSSGSLQNGADAVALFRADAADFPNGTPVTTSNLLDALVYGTGDSDDVGLLSGLGQSRQYDEDANRTKDTESNSRVPDQTGSWVAQASTPGALNTRDGGGGQPDKITLIHDIQGSGDASPRVGQTVTIEGVVVGDFQDNDGDPFDSDLGGFFVQEETADFDDSEATSEGIFVFASDADNINPGDIVLVTGTVTEYFGLTELTDVSGLSLQGTTDLPPPTEILLPATDEELEAVEGMYVVFPQELIISEYFNFDRYGEIVLGLPMEERNRLYQPTSYLDPDENNLSEVAREIASRTITLDDGRTTENPDPARHPDGEAFTLENRFRGGDIVENATGVLNYSFGRYRIQPSTGADYTVANPRPTELAEVGGRLKVATFNVLNYFTTFEERGADDLAEFERQRTKIIEAISTIDAAIVGLIEIENNGNEAIGNLVAGLNERNGVPTYDFVETGVVGTDEITVAMIYQPARVTPVGEAAILNAPSFTDPNGSGEQKNRPAVAQTFREDLSGNVFTVAVNHFKSKGSGCGEGDDDPFQGSCNGTRAKAADALVKWLATDPTGSCDPDFMIVGDLNAYDKEDPVEEIQAGADDQLGTGDDYADLLKAYPGEFAYTYVFNGQVGYLDYILASLSLYEQVTGATAWPINADEPDILDYDVTFKKEAQDALFEKNPYRASDHDPVVAGLDLYSAVTVGPVCSPDPAMRRFRVINYTDEPVFVNLEPVGTDDARQRRVRAGESVTVTFPAEEDEGQLSVRYQYEYGGEAYAGCVTSTDQICEETPNALGEGHREEKSPDDTAFSGQLRIFPNPVRTELQVSINSMHHEPIRLKVYDTSGKLIYEQHHRLTSGANQFVINTRPWNTSANQLILQFESPTLGVDQIKLLRP